MSVSSAGQQGSSQPSPERKHSIFDDPAIAQAGKDDPFVAYVTAEWRRLLAVVIAIGVVVYAVSTFRGTREARLASATRLMRSIQTDYRAFVAQEAEVAKASDADREKLQQEANGLKEKLLLKINSLEGPPPFPAVANLYRTLLAGGDVGAIPNWNTAPKQSADRMALELAAFAAAKKALDGDVANHEAARKQLLALAKDGDFAATVASHALAVSATTPEERKAALDSIVEVERRQPEQAQFLEEARKAVE